MKALFVTFLFFLLSPSYTSRIEMSYDTEDKGLLIVLEGKESIAEVKIYSGKELLTRFIPSIDTIRIKRECPLPNRINYVVTLKSGVVINDRRTRKTDLINAISYIEIFEPRD